MHIHTPSKGRIILGLKDMEEGNEAWNGNRYEAALLHWSNAIETTAPEDRDDLLKVLYSNRSAAYSKLGQYAAALIDANKAVEIDPKWLKGLVRKGDVLFSLGRFSEAAGVYEEGVQLAPLNEVVFEKHVQAKRAMDNSSRELSYDMLAPADLTFIDKILMLGRGLLVFFFIGYISPCGEFFQDIFYSSFLLVATLIFMVNLHKKHGIPEPNTDYFSKIGKKKNLTPNRTTFFLLFSNF